MHGYPNQGGHPQGPNGYPPQGPGGYGYPPPPPQRSGISPLVIVLIVLVVMLVLGGGGCLLCVGVAAIAGDEANRAAEAGAVTTPPISTNGDDALGRDELARGLETKLRAQGIPATTVRCPAKHTQTFTCELTVGADQAPLEVRDTGSGLAFDVPNTAFLDGGKLAATFASTIAGKTDGRLRVPCFSGTLMKRVGTEFSCDVLLGTVKAGTVATSVDTAQGNVHMNYTGVAATGAPAVNPTPAAAGPKVVDFVCPAGQKPGGAVRAGCLCGDQILGTACGAPGNFTEVTETPRGCRFTCAR